MWVVRGYNYIICHKEVPPVVLVKSRTRTPDHLLVSTPTWRYKDPGTFIDNGIYTREDLEKFRKATLFPAEKPAVLNSLARGATGAEIPRGDFNLLNFLGGEQMDKFVEDKLQIYWSKFLVFGSASAGCLAIYIIFGAMKYLASTIIHGYVLYTVYGWSLRLMGAFWSACANFLLHLGRDNTNNNRNRNQNKPKDENSAPPTEKDTATTTQHNSTRFGMNARQNEPAHDVPKPTSRSFNPYVSPFRQYPKHPADAVARTREVSNMLTISSSKKDLAFVIYRFSNQPYTPSKPRKRATSHHPRAGKCR